METYKNIESGVSAYEFGKDYIITLFGNRYYLYSNKATGRENVERMKELAVIGKGLSGFISQNIQKNYEETFKSEGELRAYLKRRSS